MSDEIPELEEIKALLRREPHGLSILEISRKLKIGRNVAAKYLSMLHAAGQVEVRRVAAAKLYTLAHRVPISALLGLTSDLIVILDHDLRIVLANNTFRAAFYIDSADITGHSFETFFPEATEMIRTALKGQEMRSEISQEIQGRTVQFRAKFVPVVFEDGASGVTAILEDVTCETKAAHEREMALKEKEALIHDIHYRMRNALQAILSVMRLQTSRATDPAARRAIYATEQQILSLALAHEDLYLSQNADQVRMEEYLTRLTGTIIDRYGWPSERIAWGVHAPGIEMSLELAHLIGFILTELISNVIEHAFPGNMTGMMSIAIDCDKEGRYTVIVHDTGVGIPEEGEAIATTTIRLPTIRLPTIRFLVEQYLRGRVAVECNGGTTVTITFEGESLPATLKGL